MKLSVTLSASIHLAVIAWALITVSAPAPLVAVQQEGVEVDFAIDSPSDSGRGERKAEVDPKPSPPPTERPEKAPDAKNVGEANEDSPTREGIVTEKPLDTEQAAAAPKAVRTVTAARVDPDPVVDGDVKDTPVPTTEVASISTPKAPVAEDTREEDDLPQVDPGADSSEPQAIPIPTPAPANRPKPKAAQTTQRKAPDEVKREKTATSTETDERVTDKVAQLLNSQENTAGGAKRQPKPASVGNDKARPAPQLTRGEYDALKGRVFQCWRIPIFVDIASLRIVLNMRMSRDGQLADITDITVSGVDNPSHVRAVESGLRRNLSPGACQFADVLPGEKYETWKDVRVNFEPRDF